MTYRRRTFREKLADDKDLPLVTGIHARIAAGAAVEDEAAGRPGSRPLRHIGWIDGITGPLPRR